MSLNIIDILTIVIISISIIAIIIINMTNILNKKLTDISVNIPPIEIPDPNITVKIQKKCKGDVDYNENENENYRIFIEKNENKNYSLNPQIEGKEHFSSVNGNKKTIKEMTSSLSGNFLNPTSENCVNLEKNIDEINKVLGEKLDSLYNVEIEQIVTPEIKKILENKKINRRFLNDAYKYMIKNDLMTKQEYDEEMRKIMLNSNINEDEFDPNEWYKKFQVKVPTYLEDTKTRGYNIEDFDNYANIYDIGKINLKTNYKNPKPNGFIFNNSPANTL